MSTSSASSEWVFIGSEGDHTRGITDGPGRRHGLVGRSAAFYAVAGQSDVAEALKKGYAESGYAGAWRRAADVMLAKHGDERVATDAAGNYAIAGDRGRALDLLEKAYADRDWPVLYIGVNPIFDPLRAEPRFQALLRRMNLPQ